jgi:hypothetical protein
MSVDEFPVKIWKQYKTDSIYTFSVENYSKKLYACEYYVQCNEQKFTFAYFQSVIPVLKIAISR